MHNGVKQIHETQYESKKVEDISCVYQCVVGQGSRCHNTIIRVLEFEP